MQTVIDYINTFKDKIIHIHWHDNHGSRDEHLPIGAGLIDHQNFMDQSSLIYLVVLLPHSLQTISIHKICIVYSKSL